MVVWHPDQAALYIDIARELKWASIVAMAHVFDSIGQSPIDVGTLRCKSHDGRCIDVSRAKTGMEGTPIPLLPIAKAALDGYLASQPTKLPDAPLFTNDRIGGMRNRSPLIKVHAKIRTAAGLPMKPQFQDFRTTALTKGGAAGGPADESRGLARHSTRPAGEHYVHPDERFVESIQTKRLAHRNKHGAKVG
ncbi:MAG: hypothetical protein WDN08_22015 [Rhizomicrobium sp.]